MLWTLREATSLHPSHGNAPRSHHGTHPRALLQPTAQPPEVEEDKDDENQHEKERHGRDHGTWEEEGR